MIRTQSTPTTWFILQAWRRNTGHNAQFNDRLVHVRLLLDVHVYIAPGVVERTQIKIDDYCSCYYHRQRLIGKRNHLEKFCTADFHLWLRDCNKSTPLTSTMCIFWGLRLSRLQQSPKISKQSLDWERSYLSHKCQQMLARPAREKRRGNYSRFGCIDDNETPPMHRNINSSMLYGYTAAAHSTFTCLRLGTAN